MKVFAVTVPVFLITTEVVGPVAPGTRSVAAPYLLMVVHCAAVVAETVCESVLVQVNLYAGNQYWFSVATADPKTDVTIDLYDETGKLVKTDPYADAHRAAAGFAPEASGPYYVRIENPGPPAVYSLIYSYK